MADDASWSDEELRAAAGAYLEMLSLELSGIAYSKARYRKALRSSALARRTDASIEFRMQNISAVLAEDGEPWIIGYKPAANVGTTTAATLRTLISSLRDTQKSSVTLQSLVPDAEKLMGVKAVFGELSSYVLCFGGRGEPSSSNYFSVPKGVAERALSRPFVITIGGGKDVREGYDGRVLNLAKLSLIYGPTALFVADPEEAERLSQWPVAIAIREAWTFLGLPELVADLGMKDRTILSGSQDGVIRPDDKVVALWNIVRNWPLVPAVLPLPANFRDAIVPTRVGSLLPTRVGAEEGRALWKIQRVLERNSEASRLAKKLNAARYGIYTCECCKFSHTDQGMFDAHHPTPLAVKVRITLPEHLEVLCPTCHRRAHRKAPLDPYTIQQLRDWFAAGRP